MKLPFADLLQKTKARITPAQPPRKADAPLPTAKKPKGERLGKTVLPNATRAIAPEEPEAPQAAPGEVETRSSNVAAQQGSTGEAEGRSSATFETNVATPPRRKISMSVPVAETAPVNTSEPAALTPSNAPAVVAFDPNTERAISLPLEDVIAQMPEGYLKPRASLDVSRPVLLKAADVEKGMAAGRPAIPVAALFQQAPDIFMHTVPSGDGAMIALPFERVMNALSNLAVRSDQAPEQAAPQVDTPFLQVTMEDTERFGTAPGSASAHAKQAEREEDDGSQAERLPDKAPSTADSAAQGEMRIAFTPTPESAAAREEEEQFGTGEPAFPRVPASSGPPVPPSSAPLSAEPITPARIPFSFPAPSDEATRNAETLTSEIRDQKSEISLEPILTLPLREILLHLPPMQLGGDPKLVSSEATVSFPMSMIAPQLSSGKVVVSPNAFYAALAPEYRKLFLPSAVDAPVPLPLSDVLAHLPQEALRIRADQEAQTVRDDFETQFTAKAAEDAVRLGAKGEAQKEEGKTISESPKVDAKAAVTKACTFSGVQFCSVIFADGLAIAGNIPESMHVDGLSAVAPTLLQKFDKHMSQTSLGPLFGMTIHGAEGSVSFFSAGNVCLTALHGEEGLPAHTRGELVKLTGELSQAYSQSSPSRPGTSSRPDA